MATFTVTENGVTTVHQQTPEMEKIFAEISNFDKKYPNFWCKCDDPESTHIIPKGHSVDVYCKCGGCLQIG